MINLGTLRTVSDVTITGDKISFKFKGKKVNKRVEKIGDYYWFNFINQRCFYIN